MDPLESLLRYIRDMYSRPDMRGTPQVRPEFQELMSSTPEVEDTLRGASQGASFGLADELGGAVRVAEDFVGNLMGNRRSSDPYAGERQVTQGLDGEMDQRSGYEVARDQLREQNQLSADRSPTAYTAGQIIGTVPASVALGGGLAALNPAVAGGAGAAVGAGQRALQAAGTAGIEGYLQGNLEGLGYSEADNARDLLSDMHDQSLTSAAFSAAGGAAGSLAADGIQGARRALNRAADMNVNRLAGQDVPDAEGFVPLERSIRDNQVGERVRQLEQLMGGRIPLTRQGALDAMREALPGETGRFNNPSSPRLDRLQGDLAGVSDVEFTGPIQVPETVSRPPLTVLDSVAQNRRASAAALPAGAQPGLFTGRGRVDPNPPAPPPDVSLESAFSNPNQLDLFEWSPPVPSTPFNPRQMDLPGLSRPPVQMDLPLGSPEPQQMSLGLAEPSPRPPRPAALRGRVTPAPEPTPPAPRPSARYTPPEPLGLADTDLQMSLSGLDPEPGQLNLDLFEGFADTNPRLGQLDFPGLDRPGPAAGSVSDDPTPRERPSVRVRPRGPRPRGQGLIDEDDVYFRDIDSYNVDPRTIREAATTNDRFLREKERGLNAINNLRQQADAPYIDDYVSTQRQGLQDALQSQIRQGIESDIAEETAQVTSENAQRLGLLQHGMGVIPQQLARTSSPAVDAVDAMIATRAPHIAAARVAGRAYNSAPGVRANVQRGTASLLSHLQPGGQGLGRGMVRAGVSPRQEQTPVQEAPLVFPEPLNSGTESAIMDGTPEGFNTDFSDIPNDPPFNTDFSDIPSDDEDLEF